MTNNIRGKQYLLKLPIKVNNFDGKRSLCLLLLLALLLCASSIHTQASTDSLQLKPFESVFLAYYDGDDVGEARLSLSQISDEQYELNYQSSVSKFFLSDRRYETSIFSAQDGHLTPMSYRYRREGTGSNKNLSVNFDAQNDVILVNDKKEYEWNDEFDNQLFRFDLSQRLASGEKEFDYHFINYRGEKRHYNLQVQDDESLSLPYGKVEAIKVKINRETNKRVTYAWFAPQLDYSLVRLQQFKKGKEQGDIKLKSFTRL